MENLSKQDKQTNIPGHRNIQTPAFQMSWEVEDDLDLFLKIKHCDIGNIVNIVNIETTVNIANLANIVNWKFSIKCYLDRFCCWFVKISVEICFNNFILCGLAITTIKVIHHHQSWSNKNRRWVNITPGSTYHLSWEHLSRSRMLTRGSNLLPPLYWQSLF